MRILICAENIFSEVGGGQSFYCDLVRAHTSHEFWYFADQPEADTPPNVRSVRIVDVHRRNSNHLSTEGFQINGFSLKNKAYDLLHLLDLASSVAGREFDVVDIPDYRGYGAAFPAALKALGVRFDKVAVSMHGTLTSGVSNNWAEIFPPDELEHLRYLEDVLFKDADICYGISARYLVEREAETGRRGRLLDLTRLIPFATFRALRDEQLVASDKERKGAASDNPAPAVAFIGRQEKWKGPDLFLDIVAAMPAKSFSEILFIGPETRMAGVSSGEELARMAQYRSISFKHSVYERSQLWTMLADSRLLGVFPSRRDTLNLAALETLLTGTPALVSKEAGVCDFLDAIFPGLPFARMDPGDLASARHHALAILSDYDAHRTALIDYLATHQPVSTGDSLDMIYAAGDQKSADNLLYASFEAVLDHLARGAADVARSQMRSQVGERLRDMFSSVLMDGELKETCQYLVHTLDISCELVRYSRELEKLLEHQPFLSDEQMEHVWSYLEPFCYSANRVAVYRLLARLEKARGNLLLYATYQIRCMRLSGRSDAAVLDEVAAILKANRFTEEAEAIRWMFGASFDYVAAKAYLDSMPQRFMTAPSGDIELVLSERTIKDPKISIVVSLYLAASKLAVFFDGLARLSETTRAMTEIVLIDSHSPDDTTRVVQDLIGEHRARGWNISVHYVRTSVRETIQRAWNRGIASSKGVYLAFLGVDEMNRPDAFDVMALYLDENPAIDWVQGTALVTEVNERGSFVRDVMLYDRRFDFDYMNLFDTCYIGYVGALYRKSIHDRVGYYDDRFRGAGDSEFKNRALPLISVVTLPICLGYFLNYPEERTTASPMAEIEDIRAWYLYRTSAGVGYVLGETSQSEMLGVLRRCMGYRKSYMGGVSTDMELATSIADYVELSGHESCAHVFAQGGVIRFARDMYRALDSASEMVSRFSGARLVHEIAEVIERASFNLAKAQDNLRFTGLPVSLRFSNDNRSHQHHYLWRSRSQRILFESLDPLIELAGPQDFSEALSACGASDQAVDFERAWAANDLSQLKRLQAETSLDVAIEWSRQDDVPQLIRAFGRGPGKENRQSLLVIGSRPPPQHPHHRYYFTGPVLRPGPAICAARALVVRAESGKPTTSVTRLLRAIASGLPFVADHGSVRELATTYPDLDLPFIEAIDDIEEALARAAVLAGDQIQSPGRTAAMERLLEAIRTHPKTVWKGPTITTLVGPDMLPELLGLNRALRDGYKDDGVNAIIRMYKAQSGRRATILKALLKALFVDKNAPILRTAQPIFQQIKAEDISRFTPMLAG